MSMSTAPPTSLLRRCCACQELKDKDAHFTLDSEGWSCDACHRSGDKTVPTTPCSVNPSLSQAEARRHSGGIQQAASAVQGPKSRGSFNKCRNDAKGPALERLRPSEVQMAEDKPGWEPRRTGDAAPPMSAGAKDSAPPVVESAGGFPPAEDSPRPFWFMPDALQFPPAEGACTFGLCSNVWVGLSWERGTDGLCQYWITKPEEVGLKTSLDPALLRRRSVFSPRSPLTCPWAERAQIHIPLDAHSFVWAHPVLETRKAASWLAAENDLICFLAYGGYVYFDENDEVVKINGIKFGADRSSCAPPGPD